MEYIKRLERDEVEGGVVRVVRYRKEMALDAWLDTATGRTLLLPSRTRGEDLVRVSSIATEDAPEPVIGAGG